MPSSDWPALDHEAWSATLDTLHAQTQVLGKLAATLMPPEPDFQHVALRLSARGWETPPLPAPDASGAFVAALDLRRHEAVVEHSDGRGARVALTPDRPVGEVTRELLAAVRDLAGSVRIDPTPEEVPWTVRSTPTTSTRPMTQTTCARTSRRRRAPRWCSRRSARRTRGARRR
jgi:hypothetical protein